MTLLDQISDALGASGALDQLSDTLGASGAATDGLVSAGLPAILGGLASQTSGDGMGALMGLLGDDKGGAAANLGSFFGAGDKTGLASKLVGSLFGSQRSAIESQVASSSGSTISMVSRFLPMIAPAVMGLLGKITADDGIDAEGLTAKFADLETGGPLGDIFGAQSDEDRSGFVDGIAALRDAGGLGAIMPAAATAATAAAVPAVAAKASGAATHISGSYDDEDDQDRTGLGWIPMALLLAIGLIAGLVLWQCTSSNTTETVKVAEEVEEVEEVEEAPAEPAPVVTIADIAVGSADHTTLVGLVEQLGLTGALADPDAGPFTVFAPTNAAFDAAGPVLAELDDSQVESAVTFHVVPGIHRTSSLASGATLETLSGETLVIGEGIVLPGDASLKIGDIRADNGIVHVIDGVLVPQSILDALAPEPEPEPAPPAPFTLADLAGGRTNLSTLLGAATTAGFGDPLADPDAGPFTVFAPTNDAFSVANSLISRLSPEQVDTTVGFHVVPGVFKAADLTPGTTLETVAGETIVINDDGSVPGTQVLTADLEADNGVMHIVSSVLVPGSIQRSLASADVNELFALEPIQFALGSAEILPASVPTLDEAIQTLTSLPAGTVFEVQGHTDSQGPDDANQVLSEARAASVVAYLTNGGVDADMLVPVGYGETQLKVDPEVTEEDFFTNRRIEFVDIS